MPLSPDSGHEDMTTSDRTVVHPLTGPIWPTGHSMGEICNASWTENCYAPTTIGPWPTSAVMFSMPSSVTITLSSRWKPRSPSL